MRVLTERIILDTLREEYEAKLSRLYEDLAAKLSSKNNSSLLSTDLKLKHKKSGYLYTVSSVSPRDVVLVAPEGQEFVVSSDELEKEYVID